jgi:hypothetical protein
MWTLGAGGPRTPSSGQLTHQSRRPGLSCRRCSGGRIEASQRAKCYPDGAPVPAEFPLARFCDNCDNRCHKRARRADGTLRSGGSRSMSRCDYRRLARCQQRRGTRSVESTTGQAEPTRMVGARGVNRPSRPECPARAPVRADRSSSVGWSGAVRPSRCPAASVPPARPRREPLRVGSRAQEIGRPGSQRAAPGCDRTEIAAAPSREVR